MITWCIFAILLLIITVNDFLFFRIEDENVLFLLGLYGISCIFGVSGSNFIFAFSTAILVFILTFIMNQRNLIGGGDVKLLFPLILLSENNLYSLILGTSISGVILAAIYLCWEQEINLFRKNTIAKLRILSKNKSYLLNIVLLSLSRIKKCTVNKLSKKTTNVFKQEIPYGVALSCGGFYVIVENLLAR